MRGNTIRLLLVADDRRQAWLKGLLQENFRFLTESDAASALARLHQERRVDAIILAPTQGRGLDALRRMHTDPVCHHIPVALLLENASAKEQEEAFSLGAVDVISLPAEDDLIRARFTHLKYELEKQNTLRLLQRIVRRAMKQEDPDQIFLHFLRYLGLFSQAEKVFIFEGDSHAPYYWSTSGEAGVGERTVSQRDYAALRETIDGLFAKYGSVFISDLSRCPCEDEKALAVLTSYGLKSLAALPIYFNHRRLCVVCLENVPRDRMRPTRMLVSHLKTSLIMMFANRNSVYHLRANSSIDQMTGALNRNAFDRYSQTIDPEESIGVLFADLDNLKQVNDQMGHSWGDRLLCDMAEALMRYRFGGTVFRIGGDEFVVVWQGLSKDAFYALGQQIRRHLAERNLNNSMGLYWAPDVRKGFDAVLRAADQQMYNEKSQHRLICRSTNKEESLFVEAMAKGEFTPFLQPIVNPQTNKIIGAELLARWIRGGVILEPSHFLDEMEQDAFIFQLDSYLWEEACKLQRELLDKGRKPIPLAVNVNAKDFYLGNVPRLIRQLLEKYDLPYELLILEIKERDYRRNSLVHSCVDNMYDKGVFTVMDQFGMEYDSLQVLPTLKVRGVKFSWNQRQDISEEYKQKVLESLMNLAERQGLIVNVAGIETAEQAQMVIRQGGGCAQGFYWYRPLECRAFRRLLATPGLTQPPKDQSMLSLNVGTLTVYHLLAENIISEARLNDIIGPMAIISVKNDDSQIRMRQMNRAYYRLVGRSPQDPSLSVVDNILTDEPGQDLLTAFHRADGRPDSGHLISFRYTCPGELEPRHLVARILPIGKNDHFRYYLVFLHKFR